MIERLLAAERALADGDVDRASQLFEQVVEADERNAIAVVGLAEVALARGQPDQARALAQRALAIDPDDTAATRLLAAARRAPTQETIAPPRSLLVRLGAWLRRLARGD